MFISCHFCGFHMARMYFGYLLFYCYCYWAGVFASQTILPVFNVNKSVTLVSVHVGNNPLYGYYVAHPVYLVAIGQIRKLYPVSLGNMHYVAIYLPGYDLCRDGGDNVARFFTDFYYKNPQIFRSNNSYPVVFSPECTNQVLVLADLAREFDLPLFTSVAGDSSLTNRVRYPTISAMASLARADSLAAISALMARFKWRIISLLCDKLSQFPGLNFYIGQCGDIKELFASRGYTWYDHPFDTADKYNFTATLERSKRQSRIYLILTVPEFVRELMVRSYKLNMTNGDYVFIALQPTRRPGVYPLTWQKEDDDVATNQMALAAFKSLILLTGIGPNWAEIKNLTDKFLSTSMELHNNSYSALDEENELQICIYESTRMFAQVFDENYPDVYNLSKRDFLRKFYSRTFYYSGRNVSTDSIGSKINPVVMGRLDPVTQILETAMLYDTIANTFAVTRPDLWYWVNRKSAPPDKPLCGFRNNECPPSGTFLTATTIAGALSAVILILLILLLCTLKIRAHNQLQSVWWHLDIPIVDQVQRGQYDDFSSIDQVIMTPLGRTQRWQNRQINVYRLVAHKTSQTSVKTIRRNTKLLRLLNDIRNLDHSSIAHFFGLVLKDRDVYLVMEAGTKGNLRDLLAQSTMTLDKEFKTAFCWELIEGIDYLHNSRIGHHGNLTSSVCIVDAKFSLKIANTAYIELSQLFDLDRDPVLGLPFNKDEIMYKPAEVQDVHVFNFLHARAISESLTKPCDMYAAAVIMFEILTGCPPDYVALMRQASSRRSSAMSATFLHYNQLPSRLQTLLALTLGPKETRPTVKQFQSQFQTVRAKKTNIIEHILRRLELQTEELENAVIERTRQLEEEMQTADTLLKEMLPSTVVQSLRNNVEVAAEAFDCVTLMFGDLPEFVDICDRSSPLAIITFLNSVYSVFDEVIPYFDVYKVETVKDSSVVASGLPTPNGQHASEICGFAVSMLQEIKVLDDPLEDREVQLRIGVNSGPVVASVIGVRMPRYCIFGDTMNTASRMESYGEGGKIHISQSTMKLLANCPQFTLDARGKISIKGKGAMQTYWLSTTIGSSISYLLESRRYARTAAAGRRKSSANVHYLN